MKCVYIAGPYRGESNWAIENNIRRAEELALEVWKLGAAALCPHANTRYFQGALGDSVWLEGDLELLSRCDAVMLTPDWRGSVGAQAEVAYAWAHGTPVFVSLPTLADWVRDEGKKAA